jgi:hypothetical protein
MRMRLKGINSLTKRLADGTTETYWYAWKGGPRIDAEPGTPDFIRLYSEAIAARRKKGSETFSSLIDYFRDQSEYTCLGDKSKRAYDQYLALIEARFGTMPIGAIEDRRARGDFKAFRNTFTSTPHPYLLRCRVHRAAGRSPERAMDRPAPRRPATADLEPLRWHVYPDASVEGARQQRPAARNHTGRATAEGGP